MDPGIPQQNHIGLLQERCTKINFEQPKYFEESVEHASSEYKFKFICKLGEWKTEGVSFNKKIAKQNSARAMIKKIENENLFENLEDNKGINNADLNVISKINAYSMKEKKSDPLFAEKPKEDDLFVFSCTLDDFTSVGKGPSKKIAKEKSAELVASHFGIHKYFNDLKKLKERNVFKKGPVQLLNEECNRRNLECIYKEESGIVRKKQRAYTVTCTIGELEVKSQQNISKKQAKEEAASLMMVLLKRTTPRQSPDTTSARKRTSSETIVEPLLHEESPSPKREKLSPTSSGDEL